ncbi:pyridoxamine 5'-phosphate oxidase family protein [Hydrogenophaga sp.]|uniref:pyridoxamine 5'-phosphate oxidase family protein n=1 Tax=Hydrogenophaga sp. TaxID=1904254 RepID=UPI003F6F3DAC
MKPDTQTSAERQHVADLIDDISTAMLTTVEPDGSLASRPMAPLEMDENGAIWFYTDLRSAKVEQLRAANLAFVDASDGTYVSLSGRGEIVTDRAHIERLWTAFAKPWFPEGPDSPNLGLIKFVPDAADYWDAPDSTMVRAFGVVASALAGKPIAMGEHGTHTGLSQT